ncbi:MAG: DUF4140 domain-containing protein, partial [Myxococcales bacterium]|nr:DUF4140 domain-containing protein [Myxococcales bacterium]
MRQIAAELPVVEVTLLEDRALVVRRGVVELAVGRTQLRVDGVAPVLVDKTLNATLVPGAGESTEGLRLRNLQ